MSLVTDGGGSARLPAACKGIVGLKPTFAVIPFDTALDAFGGVGHMGLVARNVRDAAIALAVARGPDPADPNSLALDVSQKDVRLFGKPTSHGHGVIMHTVRYTDMAPDRLKKIWKD